MFLRRFSCRPTHLKGVVARRGRVQGAERVAEGCASASAVLPHPRLSVGMVVRRYIASKRPLFSPLARGMVTAGELVELRLLTLCRCTCLRDTTQAPAILQRGEGGLSTRPGEDVDCPPLHPQGRTPL